jgi:hypothetical protein
MLMSGNLEGWVRYFIWMITVLIAAALPVWAEQLSDSEVAQWLQDTRLNSMADNLVTQALNGELAEVEFQLEQVKYPQQEALRTLFVQKLSDSNITLTTPLAQLVEKQMHVPSVYHIVEQGDGYEFKVPAFNYPSIAASILKDWNKQQSVMSFYLQAEAGTLDFRRWLSAEPKVREMLFLAEFKSLSIKAQLNIADQVRSEASKAWVPSSRVMVEIAKVTQRTDVYALLWKMKADGVIERELDRLATSRQGDLLIMAASHSSHYTQSIDLLTRFSEPSDSVKLYLQSEIDRSGQQSIVVDYLKSNNNFKLLSTLNTP